MDPADIVAYITATFAGVNHVEKDGDHFFIYDPRHDLKPNQQIPFITLITRDDYDTASNLARDGVYRLNIGVAKETYEKHFGDPPPFPKDGGIIQTGHDFTAFNTLLPHPIYAAMGWVCVLNPTDEMYENTLKPMLAEAYQQAKQRIDGI
jgi:hypothetical protein